MDIYLGLSSNKYRQQVHVASQISIDMRSGKFGVIAPIGDFWLRTVEFNLGNSNAAMHIDVREILIEFPDLDSLNEFSSWLNWANEEAERGFRTMRD